MGVGSFQAREGLAQGPQGVQEKTPKTHMLLGCNESLRRGVCRVVEKNVEVCDFTK